MIRSKLSCEYKYGMLPAGYESGEKLFTGHVFSISSSPISVARRLRTLCRLSLLSCALKQARSGDKSTWQIYIAFLRRVIKQVMVHSLQILIPLGAISSSDSLVNGLSVTRSYLGSHVGEQEGLVAVLLTLPVVAGRGEMTPVESAVLEVGVLRGSPSLYVGAELRSVSKGLAAHKRSRGIVMNSWTWCLNNTWRTRLLIHDVLQI